MNSNSKLRGAYALMLFLFVTHIFVGFRSAPPQGRTGAPGDGKCTDCHGGSNPQGLDGSVQITGLPAEVMPNTTYRVTVEVANPNGLSRDAGMQMVALNSNDMNAGSFANASMGARVKTVPSTGRDYLEHNPAQPYDMNRVASFSVDWTSPAEADPNVTFYAVGNITDMDIGSGTSNDLIIFETQSTAVEGLIMMEMPDLTASDVVNFGGTYAPDEVAEFSWNLNNLGNAVATNEYRIVMYLSDDMVLSTDDALVGEVPTGNTFPGTITGVPGAIRVPLNYPNGDYFMHLVVDHENTVEESNEDNNVFTTSTTITVLSPVIETLELDLAFELTCDPSGIIEALPIGGMMPYTYEWSNGETTKQINISDSGTYSVTVVDAQDSLVTAMVDAMVPAPLVGGVIVSSQPGCGGLGSAEVGVDGGTAPFRSEFDNSI